MTDHPKRFDDSPIGKALKLWPLVVALVSVIAMATTIKNTVDIHETRISRLENSMSTIQSNTDRLVYELLDKKRIRRASTEVEIP